MKDTHMTQNQQHTDLIKTANNMERGKLYNRALKFKHNFNASSKYIGSYTKEVFGELVTVERYMQVSEVRYAWKPEIDRLEILEVYEWTYNESKQISCSTVEFMMVGKANNLYGSRKGFAESEYTDGGKELSHCDVTHHNVY